MDARIKTTFAGIILGLLLSGCGGGSSGESTAQSVNTDSEPPGGYRIADLTNPIDETNHSAVGFRVEDAEPGTDYFYEINGSAALTNPVAEGSGVASGSVVEVSGIDLSTVANGIIEVRFYQRDAEGNQGEIVTAEANKNSAPVADVVISGSITFDKVPPDPDGALDYENTRVEPARGVLVEAVDELGAALAATSTDASGQYSLSVPGNRQVRIRVRAEMLRTGSPSWDVSVRDNTNNDGLYVLEGSLASSGTADSSRNLHAASGWTGSGYFGVRSAAPFAILDAIYESMIRMLAVDSPIHFPPLEVFWSRNNNTANGDLADGDIGSSFYSGGDIYILGDEDGDTDEYDSHVVVHEWSHYFENQLSRSDSIGGRHSLTERLDMRVAFSEGLGNALSAIVLDDPIYTDSSGFRQASGFTIDIDENNNSLSGWYAEASVQSLIYDFYDKGNDGADFIDLGLGPIYDTLMDPAYQNTDYLMSIFVFLDRLAANSPGSELAIANLAASQDINGDGPDGSGETNDGGIAASLPVYKAVSIDGPAVELCSSEAAGTAPENGINNSLGARDFAFLQVPVDSNVEIHISRTSGSTLRDPDLQIWRRGVRVASSQGGDTDVEVWNGSLTAGNYVLEVYDFRIIKNDEFGIQSSCFDLDVTSN